MTVSGARTFVDSYARRRKCSRSVAWKNARSAIRAWSIGLHWLGFDVPAWEVACNRKGRSPLLAEFARYRLAHCGVSESTIAHDARYVSELLSFMRRHRRGIRRIRVVDIDEFVQLYTEVFSMKTIAGVCCSIRAFLKFLHATGRLKHDVAFSVVPPRIVAQDQPPRAIPWKDVRSVLSAIDVRSFIGRRDRAMLLMMATYGMGVGEVCGLTLDDIDWTAQTMRIRRPKTGTSVVLPLLPAVAKAVADYLRDGRPRHVRSRVLYVSSRMPHGPLSGAAAVFYRLKKYADTAGVELTAGTHGLRHAYATRQVEFGAPPKIVGDILGHRNPASMSSYVRVAIKRLRKMALPVPR